MSGVIKFRAWDKEEKEMLNWRDHFQLIMDAIPYENGDEWTERCELMQFTGLRDKYGNEIYDGDICKREWAVNDFHIGAVKQEKSGRWVIGWHAHSLLPMLSKTSVIGNIYENPELTANQ